MSDEIEMLAVVFDPEEHVGFTREVLDVWARLRRDGVKLTLLHIDDSSGGVHYAAGVVLLLPDHVETVLADRGPPGGQAQVLIDAACFGPITVDGIRTPSG